MKYNIKLLQEILAKALMHNETIDLMRFSNGDLKLEYEDKAMGFPVVKTIEIKSTDS